jgi:hypothetical protein
MFCFEASIALLIALLAWGDQIRQPRKTITEVERNFLAKLGMTKHEVNPLIHKSYTEATKTLKYGFTQVLDAVVDLMSEGKLDEHNNAVLTKLTMLDNARSGLETQYALRYFLTVSLTIAFGVIGLLSILNGSAQAIAVGTSAASFDEIYAGVVLLLGALIVASLIVAYFKENRFTRLIEETDVLIEGK